MTGVAWALIHGAGLGKIQYYLPLLGAFIALWGGLIIFRRSHRGTLKYLAYALMVLGVFEVLWPGTPLKRRIEREALRGVVVQNIQDDLWLSKEGRPVGIRIREDADLVITQL